MSVIPESIPHGVRSSWTNYNCRCDDCRKAEYAYQRTYYNKKKAENPNYRLKDRRKYLLRLYEGMSEELYEQMLIEQDFKCAICGTEPNENEKHLAIDHNKETNKVRGLLCKQCNLGIGNLKHSIQLLNSAIDYLSLFEET